MRKEKDRSCPAGSSSGFLRQLKVLAPQSLVLGYSIGSLLGAAGACGLFWLVDFSRYPLDLVTLTFYTHVHFGMVGAASAFLAAAVTATRDKPVNIATFNKGLSTCLLVGVIIAILGVLFIISRRPVVIFSAGILLPILAGVTALFLLTYAMLRRKSKSSADSSGKPQTRRWLLLALLGFSVPPIFGLLRPWVESHSTLGTAIVERDSRTIGRRLLVIGWDGATWDVITPMIQEGRLKNIAELIRNGSRAVLWATPQEIQPFADSASAGARSPVLWETLGTGKLPRRHGIWDFRSKIVYGVKQAIPFRIAGEYLGTTMNTTSQMSRATRVWSLLERGGISSAVIGWLNTWPLSQAGAGIIVSDQVLHQPPGSVYPPEVVDVQELWERSLLEAEERHRDLIDYSLRDEHREELTQAYLRDYQHDLIKYYAAIEIARAHQPDFMAVVFRSTDVVQHKFWRYYEPHLFDGDQQGDSEYFADLIPRTYEFLDDLLGKLLDAMGPDTSVILMSDHGGGPWVATGLSRATTEAFRSSFHPEYSGNHRLNGVIVLNGTEFRAGVNIGDADGVDLTPTILHFFGLAVADDMSGEVLVDAIKPSTLEAMPVKFIASYETGEWRGDMRPIKSEADSEILKRLRGLGYVD